MSTELERAIGRVVEGTRHWSPARLSSRATAMHALVQALADLAADAEGQPRRIVPRLPNDTHLPDQLQVIGLDLLEFESKLTEEQRAAAEAAIQRARSALF
ncbi:hypothetical protein [Glycomyces tritici]|uniref:Uncharacterized protein n=1 Tax=Glycomyces tritici TaxID=2665176 RepID=A0ABT7YQM7_9ACTN|nr:hypothetical protein [Glycomyces tritici]MDN3240951.1 hypothetical protein [Glycomyces tritici]MDN3242846.1 hypothetical protein [Glycomyces tritici]